MPWRAKKVTPNQTPKNKPSNEHRANYGRTHVKMREVLLATFPLCQMQGSNCTGWSQEAHHLVYPATRLEDYLALCAACHKEIEQQKDR